MAIRTSDVVETITLTDGPTVGIDALRVLWHLERRGFALAVRDDRLYVTPHEQLTDTDVALIQVHRDELVALVRHCEAIQ